MTKKGHCRQRAVSRNSLTPESRLSSTVDASRDLALLRCMYPAAQLFDLMAEDTGQSGARAQLLLAQLLMPLAVRTAGKVAQMQVNTRTVLQT